MPAIEPSTNTSSSGRQQLADLQSQYAAADRDRMTIAAAADRLHAAEAAEADAIKAVGDLGATEIAAMTAWAQTGSGEPPAPDHAKRRQLSDQLADAMATAAAARGAGANLLQAMTIANDRMASIADRVRIAALDVLEEEHRPLIEALVELEALKNRLLIAAIGLPAMLHDQARGMDIDRGRPLHNRAEAISNRFPALISGGNFENGPADIERGAAVWRAFADRLAADPAATEPAHGRLIDAAGAALTKLEN